MNQIQKEEDTSTLSIEELEVKLKNNPSDTRIKEDLAFALLNRYLSEATKHDLQRLKKVVADLPPEGTSLYYRAYIAYCYHEEFMDYLVKYIYYCNQKDPTPFSNDELNRFFIYPASQKLYLQIAEAIAVVWPQSAAEWTMRGLAEYFAETPDTEIATDFFMRALDQDKHCWYAAEFCGGIYFDNKNWATARNYYLQALQSEYLQEEPDIYFCLAWCFGKLKDYPAEEKYYRGCLKIESDYKDARNNLGWSLMKQGRYAEALEIFEELIQGGKDGKNPLWNKARVLVKLKRFPEAIEAFQDITTRTGKTEKLAEREIKRIQEIMDRKGPIVDLPTPLDELEDQGGISSPERPITKKGKSKVSTTTSSEKALENMLEEKIKKEGIAFGRRLRIYDSPPRYYGRQLAFVEADGSVRRIDLLVEDLDTNDMIVIELKVDKSEDQVVGQVLSYMTWVRENLAEGRNVCGIICMNQVSDSIKRSASHVPGLTVHEYSLTFSQI